MTFETCIELSPLEKFALVLISIPVWLAFAFGMLVMLAVRKVFDKCLKQKP